MTIISPGSFTFWDSVLLFAAVILGGGSQAGVILGAFLVYGLPEFFRDSEDFEEKEKRRKSSYCLLVRQ